MTTTQHDPVDDRGSDDAFDTDWMLLTEARRDTERAEALRLLHDVGSPVPDGLADLTVYWLAEIGAARTPLAAAAVTTAADGAEAEIVAAAVHAPLRGRGVGHRLFGQLLDLLRARGARSVVLTVRQTHQISERFLAAFDFTRDGEHADGITYRVAL